MDKFCTNCGHANNSENRICVECGNQLQGEPKLAVLKEPKKPISFKAKLLTIISVALIASFAGFYSWGTQAASAETAVSKFMEAMQAKDAESLRNYLVLSNGENLSVNEAQAFIDLNADFSTEQLNELAKVERNGKFAGVFNAHKIVLMPQELSFYFPFEGLTLKLNSEEAEANLNDDGEYIFSSLVPGLYEAEFAYDDGEIEFEHGFDLYINHQENPGYIEPIDVYLPVGSTVFNVQVVGSTPANKAKVIIGDQEYPVNDDGLTEEIGPLLKDPNSGLTARAQVQFPWGNANSEAVPIEFGQTDLVVTKLTDHVERKLREQFVAFHEENYKASAARDASMFTFLTPELKKEYASQYESWKETDYYFKGSLYRVNFDGESIRFSPDGVIVDGEVISEQVNYSASEEPELNSLTTHNFVHFDYDSEAEKWIVKDYQVGNYSGRSFPVAGTSSIDGSQTLYENSGIKSAANTKKEESSESEEAVETVEEQTEEAASEEVVAQEEDPLPSIAGFMHHYNTLSSKATVNGDFSVVTHLITETGPKRKEAIDYIASVYSRGISTEHLDTTVSNFEVVSPDKVKVTTTERFIIHGTEKASEKTYQTVSILVRKGDIWLMDELVSTKEQ